MLKPFLAAFAVFTATQAFGTVSVVYDHAKNQLVCPAASNADGACVVEAADGEIIAVQVKNSVPGLFEMSIQKTDQAPEVAPSEFVSAAGLVRAQSAASPATPSPSQQPTTGTHPEAFNTKSATPITDAYNSLVDALATLDLSLRSNLAGYSGALTNVRAARTTLFSALQSVADDSSAVAKALKDGLTKENATLAVSETDLSDLWGKLERFLRVAPSGLGDLSPQVFRYIDRDFDLTVDIKPTYDLFATPSRRVIVVAQLAHSWTLRTTTGIALSGLYDEHYTKRTVIDTPATGTTPAVTHQEVVRERRDAAYPEATMFLHISKPGRRDSLTLGAGIATGSASARIYVGYGRKLGQAAAISAGLAGGNVKRLSASIDPNNPGNADPEQSRHDTFRFAPFICVSVRVGGAQ